MSGKSDGSPGDAPQVGPVLDGATAEGVVIYSTAGRGAGQASLQLITRGHANGPNGTRMLG